LNELVRYRPGTIDQLPRNGKRESPAPQLIHCGPAEEAPVVNVVEVKQRPNDPIAGVKSN
jgi:hypothetical protein